MIQDVLGFPLWIAWGIFLYGDYLEREVRK